MRFKITMANALLATRSDSMVEVYCFAEAASKAYLTRNNMNAQAEHGHKRWKINSIVQISDWKAFEETEGDFATDQLAPDDWGWGSEGEMT